MAKGYWIVRVDIDDIEQYKRYVAANAEPFRRFGARFLVRAGKYETVEGASRSRNVVIEFPSYDAALPLSLIEAMAAAVPVVAARVGGIPELVVNGVNGFLIAPGDSASLARTLRSLFADRALAARLGSAARESVRLRHAAERALPRLEELYAAMGVQRGLSLKAA